MANNNQNRGGNRNQQAQRMTENETMSAEQSLRFVLGQLKAREAEIAAVLPPDLPFGKFHATINQALRNNPKILKCTPMSIVNACVKSAYDGLRLDGKEAALVDHNVKVSDNPKRYENHAEYFPMVRGLIKKILLGREVIAMEVETIHRHDNYRVLRGTSPSIFHEPLLEGDRGPAIAYYSSATFKGGHVSHEVMTIAEVNDVRKEAKTQYVWDRWPNEMGKKSVLRRHEKKLPSGRDMIDVEARDMFPQFDRSQPHPQMIDHQPQPPARPTRALEHGEPDPGLGFGSFREEEGQMVEQEQRQNSKPKQDAKKQPAQEQRKDPPKDEVQVPADASEWAVWEKDVSDALAKVQTMEALHELHGQHSELQLKAPQDIRDGIAQQFTDRAAEIAAGPDDGAAAGDTGNDTAAGDD